MTPEITRFIVTVGIILASTVAGYTARKLSLVGEHAAKSLMTGLIVYGYTPIVLLTIWQLKLGIADVWLPVLACVHMTVMVVIGLAIGRLVTRERGEVGLIGLASAVGNVGATMGGFVVYLLYGEKGLGLVSLLGISWILALVFLMYPVSRHFGQDKASSSPGRLIFRSIFDWRSIPLPAAIIGIILSLTGVQRPAFVAETHIVDVLVFATIIAAYFAIGLRLSIARMWRVKKLILTLTGTRFGLGLLMGIALAALTYMTAWPLRGVALKVFIIESFVPMAVGVVAVANMFQLKPNEASALFVTNTLIYLLLILPFVLWRFS